MLVMHLLYESSRIKTGKNAAGSKKGRELKKTQNQEICFYHLLNKEVKLNTAT